MMLAVDPPRDPLPGDREAAREPDPLRQGRRRGGPASSAGPAGRRRRPSRDGDDVRRPLIGAPRSGRRPRRRGGRPRRPRAGAGRAAPGPGARDPAAPAGVGGRRAHLRRRPAPAGHAARARDPARGGRHRRPSSSPASRSCAGRRWRRRSSPPATGSSCTATATATSCASRRGSCSTTPSAPGRRSRTRPGRQIHDYRPPYGIFSAPGLRAIRRRGWRPVLWSLWGRDWTPAGDGGVDRRVGRRAAPAPATSCFFTTPTTTARGGSWMRTAAALPAILEELDGQGLRAVSLRR